MYTKEQLSQAKKNFINTLKTEDKYVGKTIRNLDDK